MTEREVLELQYVYSIGAREIEYRLDSGIWKYKRGRQWFSLFHSYASLNSLKNFLIIDLLKGESLPC